MPRYNEYKDSGVEWLGEVPGNWTIVPLKRRADVRLSNVDKHTVEGQSEVFLCNYMDVYKNEAINSRFDFMKATASLEQVQRLGISQGDVLLTKDSENASDIGIPSFVVESIPDLVCGYHLALIRPRARVNGHFLFYFLKSWYSVSTFETEAKGITRYALGKYSIDNLIVALPMRDEQAVISTFLDRETAKIDALVAEQEKLIALLEEKRQAVISHAVTKGLHPNVPMKDSGVEWLGEVPVHWEVRRMATLFREAVRPGDPLLPVLSISIHDGITDDELAPEDRDRQVSQIEDKVKYKRVAPNDLAYNTMRAWQGAFGAVLVDGLVSPAYVVAEPTKTFRTKFVECLLRTSMAIEEMRRYSRGITDFRMRLYWEYFRNLKVCLPPLGEQDEILTRISRETGRIDALIEEAQHSVDLLKERRSALISAAVTGKIDVRDLVVEEVTI